MTELEALGLLCLGVVVVKVAIWWVALSREEVRTMGKGKGKSSSKKGGGKGC